MKRSLSSIKKSERHTPKAGSPNNELLGQAEEIVRLEATRIARNRRKKVGVEFACLLTSTAAVYALAAQFDWFEAATKWIVTHHLDKLDEIFLAPIYFTSGLALFAFRRWRETESELTTQQQVQSALGLLHEELERRVQARTDDLDKANQSLRAEIRDRELAEVALEKAHEELVEASRRAGMAEVATGILHNVGNVLNGVNVASQFLTDSLKKSKAANLSKVAVMLREHEGDLGNYLMSDPKGKMLPGYLAQLSVSLADEQEEALKELAQLQKNIQHIKAIVTMQQSSAKAGKLETVTVTELVEDALRMESSGKAHHDIQVTTQFETASPLTMEKHKALQILTNLVRNAKQSCDETGRLEKRINLRVTQVEDRVRIAVRDNGVGIAPETLSCIFSHGYTTKKEGHGFGLHSAIAAAKEMGGALTVESGGLSEGATFTLELPCTRP